MTLRPTPDGADLYGREPVDRLRGLLKDALRRWGFRAVNIEVEGGETPATPQSERPGDRGEGAR